MMGIRFELIENKPFRFNTNNEQAVDLTQASVRNDFGTTRVLKYVILSIDMAMRPDVISEVHYGSSDYIAHILKFNGISNPFSLNHGDIIAIPELVDMSRNIIKPLESTEQERVRDQFVDANKTRQNDPGRAELERRLNEIRQKNLATNISSSNLPPNIAEPGDKEYEVRGGLIYFGGDVTKSTAECNEPISKAELRARLLKNRLR